MGRASAAPASPAARERSIGALHVAQFLRLTRKARAF